MSFSRVKTLGWALFEVLTSAQMNSLDIDHVDAIDGSGGGAYAPAAAIEISAAGLKLSGTNHEIAAAGTMHVRGTGKISVDSTAQIQFQEGAKLRFESGAGTSKIDGTFRAGDTNPLDVVSGLLRFLDAANLECRGDVLITAAGSLTVNSIAFFDSTAEFDAGVDFNGNIQVDGDIGCAGDISLTAGTLFAIGAGAVFACPVTLDSPMTLTGDGHVRSRVTLGGDVNATYSVSTSDIVWINSGVITAARTYLVNDTGAAQGSRMKFMVLGSAFAITIRRASDNSLIGSIIRNAPGDAFSLDIVWLTASGRWELLGYDTN
jgi:hypothetical protein